LKIADPYKEFVVCTDACKEFLGRVLIQEDYVISYESRKLKDHKRNYATHDLKLVAIVHALKIWHINNIYYEITISILHPNINARHTCWLAFLSEFDFEIRHIKGKESTVVDALSIKIKQRNAITISKYQTKLEDKIKIAANNDKFDQEMEQKYQTPILIHQILISASVKRGCYYIKIDYTYSVKRGCYYIKIDYTYHM
jgi:hypothetical protein